MEKIRSILKRKNWALFMTRLSSFIINRLILFIPVVFLSIYLFEISVDLGFLDFMDHSSGLLWIDLVFRQCMFWISGISILHAWQRTLLSAFFYEVYFTGFIYASFCIFDFLTALIFRNDIGSIPFGLIIVDKSGRRAARWRIIIRTFLKYLTVFLCPILLLLPLFNRRQACLHELLSGAYKVEKTITYYPPIQTQEQ